MSLTYFSILSTLQYFQLAHNEVYNLKSTLHVSDYMVVRRYVNYYIDVTGFSLSNRVLEALVLRYGAKEFMNLEGFINSTIKLHVAHRKSTKYT